MGDGLVAVVHLIGGMMMAHAAPAFSLVHGMNSSQHGAAIMGPVQAVQHQSFSSLHPGRPARRSAHTHVTTLTEQVGLLHPVATFVEPDRNCTAAVAFFRPSIRKLAPGKLANYLLRVGLRIR